MRNYCLLLLVLSVAVSNAQENLEDLLAAGIADAQRFSGEYIDPAAEGMMYSTANGWIQSAEVLSPLHFEISIVVNAAFAPDDKQSFVLNTNDYNNLYFRDGSTSKSVATALGENDPDIIVFAEVTDETGVFREEVEFTLPQGLASANFNVLPTAFLQARLGLFEGFEIKARYFPKIDQEDVKVGLFGAGLQYEFTKLLPLENLFPLAISGLVGYTNLSASYNFTDDNVINGENQQFEVTQNSVLFQLQASTEWPIFNFYGGVGYLTGTSDFEVLGTYRVQGGIPLFEQSSEFTNPFSLETKVSGARATLGAQIKLGFFRFHADYNISEFNSASVGLNFGF